MQFLQLQAEIAQEIFPNSYFWVPEQLGNLNQIVFNGSYKIIDHPSCIIKLNDIMDSYLLTLNVLD